jgi:hypothetical protein
MAKVSALKLQAGAGTVLENVKVEPSHMTCSAAGVGVAPMEPTCDEDVAPAVAVLAEAMVASCSSSGCVATRTELTFAVPRVDVEGVPCVVSMKIDSDESTGISRGSDVIVRFSLRTTSSNQVVAAGVIWCTLAG